jgi:hypothetical protein
MSISARLQRAEQGSWEADDGSSAAVSSVRAGIGA